MPTTSGDDGLAFCAASATSKPRRVWAKTCSGGEGAEDLIEEMDLDLAGGAGGCFAVLDLVAGREGCGEVLEVGGYLVAEAIGEELCAEVDKLCESDVFVCTGGPAEFVAEACGVREGWSLHDLEVLLVLGGGAGGDLVKPLAGVLGGAEAGEGSEELVVAGGAGGGDEAAHREAVDESVVEVLVFEEKAGGDLGLGANTVPGSGEREGDGVDAEALLDCFGEEGFGVDGAGEMHMEVGTLGHGGEEGIELGRAELFCGVEGTGGALLGCR